MKRHSRSEITRILVLGEREGLTYEELAERTGVARRTLSWWSWRERKEARTTDAFTELVHDPGDVLPSPQLGTIEPRSRSGVSALVSATTDDVTLARLIDLLGQSC